MPLPSHRLDLCIVPASPTADPPEPRQVFDLLAAERFATPDGAPGPRADDLVAGGFVRARLDLPGRVALFANGQGGFRVFCPACGANVTQAWSGLEPAPGTPLACRCGRSTPLADLRYAPDAAFARWALVLGDVADGSVRESARATLARTLGALRVIGRRVGR